STSHPMAAQAGVQMLLKGGTAIDAAIAGAIAMTLVEPVSCGLGGDCFAIVSHQGKLHGLNASGPAPMAWHPDYFKQRYGTDGQGFAKQTKRGCDTVPIPVVV